MFQRTQLMFGLSFGLAIVLVASSGIAQAAKYEASPFRCQGVAELALSEMMSIHSDNPCSIPKMRAIRANTLAGRMEILETCSCNVINKGLVWLSMVNTKVETLYQAVYRLVKMSVNREAGLDDNMKFMHHYLLWSKEEDDPKRTAEKWYENFCASYDPNGLLALVQSKHWQKNKGKAEEIIEATCFDLELDFGPFQRYFDALDQVARDPNFHYRVAAFDERLMKVLVVYEMCTKSALAQKPVFKIKA